MGRAVGVGTYLEGLQLDAKAAGAASAGACVVRRSSVAFHAGSAPRASGAVPLAPVSAATAETNGDDGCSDSDAIATAPRATPGTPQTKRWPARLCPIVRAQRTAATGAPSLAGADADGPARRDSWVVEERAFRCGLALSGVAPSWRTRVGSVSEGRRAGRAWSKGRTLVENRTA